jgi:penicillin-binding protein 2
MYDKRIKIFILVIAALLVVCLLRLIQMQLLPNRSVQDEIAQLKLQRGRTLQLKTLRGRILDRKDRVLAVDQPQFQLCINYELTTRIEDMELVIEKCTHFGLKRSQIETKIAQINHRIWNLRTFVAWVRAGPDPAILDKYNHNINSIPLSEAIADFEKKFPDEDQRLSLVRKVDDIAEMDKDWPLLELKTDDDIFTAQLEFADIAGVQILPKGQRSYPYRTIAAQTIGWVGPATQEDDKALFADDSLSSYLDGEVCGREDGVEYVCEAILRGRRGELIYDIDRQLVSRTETQFGEDVRLTLDVELQKRIEDYLANSGHNPNYKAPTAAVVIDVATGDILALVSMPVFDLNRIRADFATLAADPNEPLRNRAINKQYPPGSVIKPLILIAGLESGKITADEVISCPAQKAPSGWPSCWIYNRYSIGHDSEGLNNAHNATKGSCNIYFSRLADRIEPRVLQQWLFKFGYGRVTSLVARDPSILRSSPDLPAFAKPPSAGEGRSGTTAKDEYLEPQTTNHEPRELRQAQGQISNLSPKTMIQQFEQIPPLEEGERRWFGIGQGNLRVTPLQVANAMAAIARNGVYKPPRLFFAPESTSNERRATSDDIDLVISPQTLATVCDGMYAVVNEPGGTAYKELAHSGLTQQGIKVYGKTGSTEKPDNAWFAGFAADGAGHKIAIAILVEGGQHGSSDAAPLARDIIQFCIDAGYIGKTNP